MKIRLLTSLSFFTYLTFIRTNASAQTDSTQNELRHELQEVVITGFQPNNPKYTSINIEPYSLQQINEKAPFNLSDALAKLPGISQITTGNSISKPVIRGLYGNRILILLSGLRFDNQQWQDEHGLGLSQIGIDRVEIIKGPVSLLYGSDALGGVINVVEEKPLQPGRKIDVGTQFFTNTLGTLTDVGISERKNQRWWRLRLGIESHSDYSDGNHNRVLNSRNGGYYLKAGFGFDKPRWKQENSYNFSYNQFGFILEDLTSFFSPDSRWSREMTGPHHNVMLNLLNSQNTFFLRNSVLKVNAGLQSNSRKEDEGGGQISLNMHLFSALENLRWEKQLTNRIFFVGNQQFTFSNNTNYGGRIIIPDANLMEGNVSGYFKFFLKQFIVETGLGGNYKLIQTFPTRSLNSPGEPIQPFTINKLTGNAMVGVAYNPSNWLTIKTNTASGFRAPNLAELSSNGLHEGVYRYEIGDPNLKVEQNVNTDLTIECHNQQVFMSLSGYYNRFFNYVYLAPTTDTFYGFPVYRFRQQNARLFGSEVYLTLKPASLEGIQWKEGFTVTQGKLDEAGNSPFIPAYKLTSALRFEKALKSTVSRLFLEPELVYVFRQERPAQFETPTAAYYLVTFSSGVVIPKDGGNWRVGITATNLTNNKYVDHLSRLKYYGLLNQGINVVLSVRKEFR